MSKQEKWETRFNNRFGFGVWDSRAVNGHRSEGINSSDIVEFIRSLLHERDERVKGEIKKIAMYSTEGVRLIKDFKWWIKKDDLLALLSNLEDK